MIDLSYCLWRLYLGMVWAPQYCAVLLCMPGPPGLDLVSTRLFLYWLLVEGLALIVGSLWDLRHLQQRSAKYAPLPPSKRLIPVQISCHPIGFRGLGLGATESFLSNAWCNQCFGCSLYGLNNVDVTDSIEVFSAFPPWPCSKRTPGFFIWHITSLNLLSRRGTSVLALLAIENDLHFRLHATTIESNSQFH